MNDTNTGFEAFQLYTALKLHFCGKYDFVKYNGKTNISKDQFLLRKDKYSFYKLSRKYNKEDLFGFIVANLLKNPKTWVGDLLTEDADSEYKLWLKIRQSISYVFEQDLNKLFDKVENPDELLKVVDGQYPLLYNEFLQQEITLETVIILDDILNFMPMWSKKIDDDILFPEFTLRCKKYKPFVHYDKAKCTKILKDKLCLLT